MATNDFLPFATGSGANVLSQAEWAALTQRLSGFQSGVAKSDQLNKAWRQSSIMAAVIAGFIADITGQDVIDDGTTATILANLKSAVSAQSVGVVGAVRNARMVVSSTSSSATYQADEVIVQTALSGQTYRLTNVNKTIDISTTGAGGMDVGTAPASSWIAVYLIYNPVTRDAALLGRALGSGVVAPEIYGGSNMPAGYTASALISLFSTTSSAQIFPFTQRDRRVNRQAVGVFNSSTNDATWQPVNLVGAVPPNAKSASGYGDAATTAGAVINFGIGSSSSGIGNNTLNMSSSGAFGVSLNFDDVHLDTLQTLYVYRTASAGTPSFTVYIRGYEF
ncbi:hypothetical protein NDR89_19490 [Cupriavidus gilardii]|uniref:Phage tail protein n=1 Tax=Cupriavidus gilardii TaxID=82541 RepID=A0ABY4VS48_9BURK|nr:hypothetical protein [Cupriavidus gilardii]USE78824.1 hypothetical protein NDR89_19490 [Cupriavidus gilardii]